MDKEKKTHHPLFLEKRGILASIEAQKALNVRVEKINAVEVHGKTPLNSEALCYLVRDLSKPVIWRGVAATAADWTIIMGCFTLAMIFPNPFLWFPIAFVIASRQHALLILMHDAAHYLFLPNHSWNDLISNWFHAYPLFVSIKGYRNNHLPHHFYLNTVRDPDWMRKSGKPDWEFPKTRLGLLALLVRDLIGGGFLEEIESIWDLNVTKQSCGSHGSENSLHLWSVIAYYAFAFILITLSGFWMPVLLYWYLPAFTILPVLLRIRSIAEHFGLEGRDDLSMARNYIGPRWERFVFYPHNINYHLDHHLYPSVSYHLLPKLHQLLMTDPYYAGHAHQNDSLLSLNAQSVLADITSTPSIPRPESGRMAA